MTTNSNSLAFDAEKQMLICELCVRWASFDELYVDNDGVRWDVCKECGEHENGN